MVKLARLGGRFYNPEFLLPPGSDMQVFHLSFARVASRILDIRPRSTACTARINIIAGMKTIGTFPKIFLEATARSNS
jgi:hypothetical protein